MTIPRVPALMLGVGVALLYDVLRVFLPSLITLFGQAGSTPPELMGLYAAAWFTLPFLALLLPPRWALTGGAVALVLARLLLQAGVEQLYVASAGVTAGLVFLYGCARTVPRPAAPVGITGGLSFSILVHLLLDGVDLVWRDGVLPWLMVTMICALFLALVRAAFRTPERGAEPAPWPTWFLFGPALLLAGLAATSWAKAAEGPSLVWTALGVGPVAVAAVAAVSAVLRPRHGPAVLLAAGLGLVASTALLLTAPWPGVGAVAGAVTILCLAPVLTSSSRPLPDSGSRSGAGSGSGSSENATRPESEIEATTESEPAHAAGAGRGSRAQGVAVLGGGVVFLVAMFAYYAAYDLNLGIPNQVIPIAVSVLAVAVGLRPSRARFHPREVPSGAAWENTVLAVMAGLIATAIAWPPSPAVRPAEGDTITLITYNIRMGYGLDGRLSLGDIATWAAAQKPDVVLLSEVDRGWLLNGGHDDLARIARRLDMRYHFAPAADDVWGDALLTNLPIKSIHSHKLGRHDYPTGAQAQAVVLDVGGRELGIVNTHLQAPAGQAPEVAAIARNLAAGLDAGQAGPGATASSEGPPRPVILAGDLNTEPADPEMRVLEAAGLSDPLIALGDPPTSPAEAPVKRIDHVLISRGLTAVSAQAPRLPYSDHLPVLTTLRLTTVDQEG
ncbi:endonuclease/exonuclease/phosphatase family protein [Nonomuraea sp. NPDC048916]|uniref:endonuclease/exonuclease/phosphatase family protein n=1 Tax=Nonomuraea sp. NPDC048916 TaxID=3154232 RepID=UPI0033C6DDA5